MCNAVYDCAYPTDNRSCSVRSVVLMDDELTENVLSTMLEATTSHLTASASQRFVTACSSRPPQILPADYSLQPRSRPLIRRFRRALQLHTRLSPPPHCLSLSACPVPSKNKNDPTTVTTTTDTHSNPQQPTCLYLRIRPRRAMRSPCWASPPMRPRARSSSRTRRW